MNYLFRLFRFNKTNFGKFPLTIDKAIVLWTKYFQKESYQTNIFKKGLIP